MPVSFKARDAPARALLATLTMTFPTTVPIDLALGDEPCVVGGGVGTAIPRSRPLRNRDIQGAVHISPCSDRTVVEVPGVVATIDGGLFWMQDPVPAVANPPSDHGPVVARFLLLAS